MWHFPTYKLNFPELRTFIHSSEKRNTTSFWHNFIPWVGRLHRRNVASLVSSRRKIIRCCSVWWKVNMKLIAVLIWWAGDFPELRRI
jgi:hypothetical protein